MNEGFDLHCIIPQNRKSASRRNDTEDEHPVDPLSEGIDVSIHEAVSTDSGPTISPCYHVFLQLPWPKQGLLGHEDRAVH